MTQIAGSIVFFFMVLKGFFGPLPGTKELSEIAHAEASLVYDAHGKGIGRYYIQDRDPVTINQISPFLIKALIATEDQRFYTHQGIDLRSLARVIVKSIFLQKSSSGGGSTLTQQLVKNLYPRKKYGAFYYPVNKTRELITAYRLEQLYSKTEILELYLNTVSFGEDVYGVESAAQRYFNTSAKALNQQQSATLVGMLKATTSYNPVRHPQAARQRRNVVLMQMVKQEFIDKASYDLLSKLPMITNYQKPNMSVAPYFLVAVKRRLKAFIKSYNAEHHTRLSLRKSGLKIYTTLDVEMQKYAEQAANNHMATLQLLFDKHWNDSFWNSHTTILDKEVAKIKHGRTPQELSSAREMQVYGLPEPKWVRMSPMDSLKYHLKQLQAGFLAMNPNDGAIKAWVGGLDFSFYPYDHVAPTAKRQVGSTFKPIVYATALEKGISPCTYFKAAQKSFSTDQGEWQVSNDHGNYQGKYSMKGALEESVNTVAVNLMNSVGITTTITQAQQMGIKANLPQVPSLALGVAEIPMPELVAAYCTFVNGGYKVKPHAILRIEDNQGNVLYEYEPGRKQRALSEKTAIQMTKMLQGVVDEGTGKSLRTIYKLPQAMGGKTGTTQGNADGWFVAITPHLVAGSWVGGMYPSISFKSTALGQGATMALPIWAGFYKQLVTNPAYANYTKVQFRTVPQQWAKELDCDPFKEEFNLMNWLFKNKKSHKSSKNHTDQSKNKKEHNSLLKKIGKWFKKE